MNRRTRRLALWLAIAALAVPGATASAAPSAIVVPAARPSAPRAVTATPAPTAVTLSWTAPSSTGGRTITSYRVQRQRTNGTWLTLTSAASASRRTYQVTGLTNGTRYSFRIAAINADGTGPNSATVSATPRPLALAPRSFTATPGDGSVRLAWSAPRGNGSGPITGYRIQRRGSNGRYTTVTTVAGSKRSHLLTGLANGSTVSFRINAVTVIGQGASTTVRSVTLPFTLAVAAGGNHTCAVLPDTSVSCWGSDVSGELGDGTLGDDRSAGAPVVGPDGTTTLTGVASVDAALYNTCAVMIDGRVMCWGNNSYGQLGDVVRDSMGEFLGNVPHAVVVQVETAPDTLAPLDDATQVVVGERHACALLSDGTVRCWGGGDGGQRGDNTTVATVDHPVEVLTIPTGGDMASPLDDVVQISGGDFHTCARLTGGTVRCWGANLNGRIGDGTTEDALVATSVSGITSATSIGLGEDHSCAVLSTGRAQCWGNGLFNEMGDNTADLDNPLPVDVLDSPTGDPLDGIASISGGQNHTCALMTDGTVRCWGEGPAGQRGDGDSTTETNIGTPVTVVTGGTTALSGATTLSVGGDHACVQVAAGALRCWGYNFNGQVGDGTTNDAFAATPVTAI